MPTTAQPAAGTALDSGWASSLIWARNEAETTPTVLAAGSGWTRSATGSGVNFATDADGRYLTGVSGGSFERWGGVASGSEFTLFAVVKRVASGGFQALIDSDDNPPRNWQFAINSDGTVNFTAFNSSNGFEFGLSSAPGVVVSTSVPTPVIVRVQNVGGTYKAVVQVGAVATAPTSYSGTPNPLGAGESFSLGDRLGGNQPLTSKVYFAAVWNRALTDSEMAALGANGWAAYDAPPSATTVTGGVTLDAIVAAGTFGVQTSSITGAVTLDDAVAAGSFAPAGTSALTGAVTLDDATATGAFGSVTATIVSQPFKSTQTGLPVGAITLARATLQRVSDGLPVVNVPSPVTGSDSTLTITSTGLVAGVAYMLNAWNADGTQAGIQKVTAA